jgi:type I restriction enzyme M protein
MPPRPSIDRLDGGSRRARGGARRRRGRAGRARQNRQGRRVQRSHLKEIKGDKDARDERPVLTQWLTTSDDIATCKRQLKTHEAELDAQVLAHYARLTTNDIQTLVIHDKWLTHLSGTIDSELSRVTQTLTSRIRQLVERYETPLPTLVDEVNTLAAKVEAHLARMGVVR